MATITLSSEQFRLNWGETIHKVLTGHQLVVERYNRPAFVVMHYEQYEAMRERLAALERNHAEAEFARQFAAIAMGNFIECTVEDIERMEREATDQP